MVSGFYEQIIWRKTDEKKDEWFEFEHITPTINGKPLDKIPFWFVAPEENEGDVSNPPIEDMA
jgi:hypothetical protein